MAALRVVINTFSTHQKSLSVVIVDFTTALDSACGSLSWVLSAYCVLSILINSTMDLYNGSTAPVDDLEDLMTLTDRAARKFEMIFGVLQDSLSHLLFLLAMDFGLTELSGRSSAFWHPPPQLQKP